MRLEKLKKILNIVNPLNLLGMSSGIVFSVASLSVIFTYAAIPEVSPLHSSAYEDKADIKIVPEFQIVQKPTIIVKNPSGKAGLDIPRHIAANISRGNTRTMKLSLTFDGGYSGKETTGILDILKEKGIRTTVFLTGAFMVENPDIVRRIVSDGHEVGNHTMTHPHLTNYSKTAVHTTLEGVDRALLTKELGETKEVFKAITGKDMARLWRAPYGEINKEIISWALDEGFTHVGWTVDYKAKKSLDTLDWVADQASPLYLSAEGIREKIIDFEHESGLNGGIVLMHLGTNRNSERVSDILAGLVDELSLRGYSFAKVSELVADKNRLAR
ncbi:MAG: polysaccharide deacetylase family protein [Deltaproteobacteria bacterium]|nr:polysaccharide deacetylase family protein [Deltaproteobacteria bacterium]